tara:strand:+ start:686 stop:967 length:282 start_codon:yes stop_codon:yes gene_type:complete
MPRYHNVDNVKIPFTAEEESARDAEEAAWTAGVNDRAFVALRKERDNLLAETDWWATSDLTITQAQKDYRKALRDLPANTADPTDVTWPTKPS